MRLANSPGVIASTTSDALSRHAPTAPSFLPREHGAYGQLALPLAAALGSSARSGAAWLFAAAACAAFVAHEPLLVLLGARGARARREHAPFARRHLALRAAAALVLGAAGMALAPDEALLGILLPLTLGVLVLPFVLRGAEKTLPGEMLALAALSSASFPVLLSGGTAAPLALAKTAAWIGAAWGATASVHVVLAHHRRESILRPVALLALAIAAVLALGLGLSPAALAAAPVLAVASAIVGLRPHPRRLRTLGWTLLSATVVTAILTMVIA